MSSRWVAPKGRMHIELACQHVKLSKILLYQNSNKLIHPDASMQETGCISPTNFAEGEPPWALMARTNSLPPYTPAGFFSFECKRQVNFAYVTLAGFVPPRKFLIKSPVYSAFSL